MISGGYHLEAIHSTCGWQSKGGGQTDFADFLPLKSSESTNFVECFFLNRKDSWLMFVFLGNDFFFVKISRGLIQWSLTYRELGLLKRCEFCVVFFVYIMLFSV